MFSCYGLSAGLGGMSKKGLRGDEKKVGFGMLVCFIVGMERKSRIRNIFRMARLVVLVALGRGPSLCVRVLLWRRAEKGSGDHEQETRQGFHA